MTGRESVFSAGFDLHVLKRGGVTALRMLGAGYALTARVMAYPYPVLAACNGHSLAMGVFLMLSADYVIGSRGDFKIAANEVAIGMTMPRVAAAMLRHRLNPAAFQRAVTLSKYFDVDSALNAGFFDELVDPADLIPRAEACADEFKKLDPRAHAASKRRIRSALMLSRIYLNPFPSSPTRLSAGIRRSSKKTSVVAWLIIVLMGLIVKPLPRALRNSLSAV